MGRLAPVPRCTVEIVIVNWNAGDRLRRALESLRNLDGQVATLSRVTVVDNASHDTSLEGLESLPLPLRILRNSDNRGFGVACNQGAEESTADFLLFLNPDTEVRPNSLDVPAAFLLAPERKQVGVVSIQLRDERGEVSRTCARFPSVRGWLARVTGLDAALPNAFPSHFMREWDHRDTRSVDHVIGAFYFVRRTAFEEVGGFDPRFFVYLEDVDLSLRLRRAGWECWFLADAHALHEGGGTSSQIPGRRLFYSMQSRLVYARRHLGWGGFLAVTAMTLTVEPLLRMLQALVRLRPAGIGQTLLAYGLLLRSFGQILGRSSGA